MCFQDDLDLYDLQVSDRQEIEVISAAVAKQLGEFTDSSSRGLFLFSALGRQNCILTIREA